jgi:hypothetical protein
MGMGGRFLGPVGEISSDVDWLWELDVFPLDAQHLPVPPRIGRVVVDQQNLGHVEWWRWLTTATPNGYQFQVKPPPTVLEKPAPRPQNANDWTTYGDQTVQWTAATGTVGPYSASTPWFTITDQGNTWYVLWKFATATTAGFVRWYRPAASPPWLFGNVTTPGPAGNFLPVTSVVTLPAGMVKLTEVIPLQPPTTSTRGG